VYKDKKISEYLEELASKNPVPGGGSAAALVGAAGAALLSKVANFTIGKDKYKAFDAEAREILGLSEEARNSFIRLTSDDARAYKKLSEAFKLPKGDERQKKIQKALEEAMAVPLEVCKVAREALKLCLPLAEKGNKGLITDVGDAAFTLLCAFRSAVLNVEINAKSVKDADFVSEARKMLGNFEKEMKNVNDEIQKKVKEHIL